MVELTSGASRSDGEVAEVPWSLADTEATRLVLRLIAAALGVGIVGGVVVAWLSVISKHSVSSAAVVLTIGLPLVLTTMIGWRLATGSNRWLGRVAGIGVLMVAAVQGLPEASDFFDNIGQSAGVMLLVMIFGAIYGLAPALAAVVVLVPVLLVRRWARSEISLASAQALVTGVAMVVTGAFALWVGLSRWSLVGLAAALAGTGAVITARWSLVDRRA